MNLRRFRATKEEGVPPGAWTLSFGDENRSFVAEFRPDKKKWGRLCLVGLGGVLLCLYLQSAFRMQVFQLGYVTAMGLTCVPFSAYLDVRKAYFRRSLDFVDSFVHVEDVRGLGPKQLLDSPLEKLILLDREERALRFGWKDDPESKIIVDCASEAEAEEAQFKLRLLLSANLPKSG